jgi:hypothetical protein
MSKMNKQPKQLHIPKKGAGASITCEWPCILVKGLSKKSTTHRNSRQPGGPIRGKIFLNGDWQMSLNGEFLVRELINRLVGVRVSTYNDNTKEHEHKRPQAQAWTFDLSSHDHQGKSYSSSPSSFHPSRRHKRPPPPQNVPS